MTTKLPNGAFFKLSDKCLYLNPCDTFSLESSFKIIKTRTPLHKISGEEVRASCLANENWFVLFLLIIIKEPNKATFYLSGKLSDF